MSQSRHVWLLGGAVGGLLTLVALSVKLASSTYSVHVTVTDSNGPLAGVWVAMGESDVRTTNEQGVVVFTGTRYGLDDSVLTVSDPSLTQLHLSESVRAKISWLPWEKFTKIAVSLPVFADRNGAFSANSDEQERKDIDLPEFETGEAFHGGNPPEEITKIPLRPLQEEDLAGAEEGRTVVASDGQLVPSVGFDLQAFSMKICAASGLGEILCASVVPSVIPPFRDVRQIADLRAHKLSDESALNSPVAGQAESTLKPESGSPEIPENLRAGVKLEVSSDGRPLAGAKIFMSRMRDRRVRELGTTNSDGVLDSKVSKAFFGETVTVFHSCCSPKSFAANFAPQTGAAVLKLQMSAGKGFAIATFQQAYGLLRKVEHTDVFSSSAKLGVSGSDGFAIYDATKTPDVVPAKIVVRNSRPSEFRIPAKISSAEPVRFIVMPEQNFIPSVAVLERNGGKPFGGILKNPELRRWRREFMTRMMRLTSVRTVVSTEAEARVASSGESLSDVISRGWAETQLAGEWDFLLSLQYDEDSGKINLSAVNARGEEFFSDRTMFGDVTASLPAESIARKNFEGFLNSFPFEGAVLKQEGREILLSFENSGKFGMQPGTHLAIFQETPDGTADRQIEDLAVLAVVADKGKGKLVEAGITHWNRSSRKTEVLPDLVRAVKISPVEYLKASKRRGMQPIQTSLLEQRRNKPL